MPPVNSSTGIRRMAAILSTCGSSGLTRHYPDPGSVWSDFPFIEAPSNEILRNPPRWQPNRRVARLAGQKLAALARLRHTSAVVVIAFRRSSCGRWRRPVPGDSAAAGRSAREFPRTSVACGPLRGRPRPHKRRGVIAASATGEVCVGVCVNRRNSAFWYPRRRLRAPFPGGYDGFPVAQPGQERDPALENGRKLANVGLHAYSRRGPHSVAGCFAAAVNRVPSG